MSRLLFSILVSAVCAFAQNNVPSEYQAIYTLINTQLTTFDSQVRSGWNGAPYSYMTSPQLLAASSDQYTNLLTTDYYTLSVEPELVSLQALGAQAVTVHIDMPILYEPFYASSPTLYQQFVSFYQQLVQDVHSRGMKLIVETTVGSALTGNLVSDYESFYASLNWRQYLAARAGNALNIAQLIQPDYMTVLTEPDSEATNSGQTNAGTLNGSTNLLKWILTTLKSGNVTNVSIGAGAGTWLGQYTEYIQNYLLQPIDFLDMHLYPVNNDYLQNAATGAQMAHAAGKQVGMSECWDWKIANDELGVLTYPTIEARNPFGFWAPEDQQFLATLKDLGQADEFTFISPFWSHYFNAYVSYTEDGSLSSSQVLTDSYTAANTALNAGRYSSTGTFLESLLLSAPDTTPPAVPAAPTLTATGSTEDQIAWTPDTDNVGVAGYAVFRNGTPIAKVNAWSYVDTGLTPGATYDYRVQAFDASGNYSPFSDALAVVTVNTTPPTAPSNLEVTATTSDSVSLSWTASYGDYGIAGYTISRGTSSTDMTYIATGVTTTTYTDSRARPNTTYYYEVKAYITDGLSGPESNVVSTTTPKN